MSRRTAIHWAGEVRGPRFWAVDEVLCVALRSREAVWREYRQGRKN